MQDLKIRRAEIGDEKPLAQVHIKSWQETYKGLIPQSYLENLPSEQEERTQNWARAIKKSDRWIWVAEVSGEIVVFCLFGPPRDKDREGFIELGAIYLLAAHKSQGIGYKLLSDGFKMMSSLGYAKAYCWVLDGNPTINFYQRTGAKHLGQTKLDEIAGQQFKELAMEWGSIKSLGATHQ